LQEKFYKKCASHSNGFANPNIEIFINLLLIYSTQHERDKIKEILNKKFYWFFISKIIVRKLDFYLNLGIELPIGLIKRMLEQKNMTLDNILKLLSFGNSISEILKMIIDNFQTLSITCKENNYIIIMSNFQNKEYLDNIEELINNIIELIKKKKKLIIFLYHLMKNFGCIILIIIRKILKN
jgi:hypothetical protein